jgi:glucosamine-6-phosphate deaminase
MAEFTYDPAECLTFRDAEACRKARQITREQITDHPNGNFTIKVIENEQAFAFGYIIDILTTIKTALDENRPCVLILPAPNPNYALLAHMINQLKIPCHHVHTFNMDEYADQDGNSAPLDFRGGFRYWMYRDLFDRIDPTLRMDDSQIHFPMKENVNDYSRMLDDLGGAEKAYGGIGWCGHIAFYEPHVAVERHGEDMDSFLQQGTSLVDLHPITCAQNSLYGDAGAAGDWSWVPPKAYTIGPKDLADSTLVSFWDGFGAGEGYWQRFISRLAAFGPVTPAVPASMLQIVDAELILSGPVAANCDQQSYERAVPIRFPD